MPDTSRFTIRMKNAEGSDAEEPNCRVMFKRTDETAILDASHVVFPPARTFQLPAFPREQWLFGDIVPSLYQPLKSRFFMPMANTPQVQEIVAVRLPSSWTPVFTPLANLTGERFQPLVKVIKNSTQADVKHGRDLGRLDAAYGDLQPGPEELAKMALLNLYAVGMDTQEPINKQPWFSYVKQIVRIDRERFIAEASPDFFDLVQKILENIGDFAEAGFFTEPAGLHYDNIPLRYALTSDLITVKVRYEQGNTQFTVGKSTSGGKSITLLDCDMDEHSNLIAHTGDLFIHTFTGGTHPVDMHEYIVHKDPGIDLGYELEPAEGRAQTAAA